MNIMGGRSSRYQFGRYFNQVGLLAPLQGVHPVVRRHTVVNLGPAVTHADVIALEIAVHQAVVVFDAVLQEQFVGKVD